MSETQEAAEPDALKDQLPGGTVVRTIVAGIAVIIPVLLLIWIFRYRQSGLPRIVNDLPDPAAEARLLEMGPAVAGKLSPFVYKAEKPDARQLAIIRVIVKLGKQDNLPIFVRRAYYADLLKKEGAADRLLGLRGIKTLGPPWPLRDMSVLLDDHREAKVHQAPALIARRRRELGDVAGVVRFEAADMLGAALGVVMQSPNKEDRITPKHETGWLTPELQERRIKMIKEKLARTGAASGSPSRRPVPKGSGE